MANNNQDSDSADKFAEDMDELTGKEDKRDENAEARKQEEVKE